MFEWRPEGFKVGTYYWLIGSRVAEAKKKRVWYLERKGGVGLLLGLRAI